jgi:hypothetical protein
VMEAYKETPAEQRRDGRNAMMRHAIVATRITECVCQLAAGRA